MSGLVQKKAASPEAVEAVLLRGDLGQLSEPQRLAYYEKVCASLGLNPLTKPFEYIRLNNKLVLYAKRDCTDQLRSLHKVSVKIVNRERIDDVYVVTAQATMPDGRCDESVGAVQVGAIKGDALANALMKAETKAKRRVTLSICGLGLLDETELETIPEVKAEAVVLEKKEMPEVAAHEDERALCHECNRPMMVSKFDENLYYCTTCKIKRPR